MLQIELVCPIIVHHHCLSAKKTHLNKGRCLWSILFSDFQKLLTQELKLLPYLIVDSGSIRALDSSSPVHTQVHLVLQKWLLAFFYCGLMHTTACSRCLSAPVTCWAKWQQQTGGDNAKKRCNAVLFFSLCLKENVAVTYHFAILSILKVKKIVWSLNIHTLPCCCLWAMG